MPNLRHLHYLLLLILGFIIYRGAINGPFIFDDNIYILENFTIRSLSNFTDLSGTRYIVFLSFALNYAVDGYNEFGYKLTNIAIHIINSMLVYKFVSILLETPTLNRAKEKLKYLPFIVSLLFLAHPIETQAVNYTVGRFATLATLFYLLSITLYLKARLMAAATENKRTYVKRYLVYALALIAAVIAQKSKEISFTLPFMIVIFDLTFFPVSIGFKKRLKGLLPFLFTLIIIPASIYLPTAGGPLDAAGAGASIRRVQIEILSELSSYDYLITQFKVIPMYLKLFIFPANQNLLHVITTYDSFFNIEVILSFIFLAVIFAFALYLLLRSIRRKEAAALLIGTGILWFFITISVESSIIPLKYKMFEHRAYLPSIGFFISITTAFLYFSRALFSKSEKRSKLPLAIIVIIIAVLSILSYQRSSVWKDKFSIWSDTVTKSPGNSKAHDELGTAYMELGKKKEAIYHYREAIRINPRSGNAIVNLGNALTESGRFNEAITEYRTALKINPYDSYAFYNYGFALANLGKLDDAKRAYQRATELNPIDTGSRNNLANIYMSQKKINKAEALYIEVIEIAPGHARALNNLGIIMSEKKEYEESLSYFKRAAKADPDYSDAHFNMGITLKEFGREEEALEEYRAVLRLDPAHAGAMNNIGAILLKKNDYTGAYKHFKEALRIEPSNRTYKMNLEIALSLTQKSPTLEPKPIKP